MAEITALMRAHSGQKSIWILFPYLAACSSFSLTRCQISKSKLPSSGNQGLHSVTVWRQASIRWHETESPCTVKKWWSKVEKWWGFPAFWPMSSYLPASIGPRGHSLRSAKCTRLLFGCHLLRSFNGQEPGGPESTDKKVKARERGWYSLVYAESQ